MKRAMTSTEKQMSAIAKSAVCAKSLSEGVLEARVPEMTMEMVERQGPGLKAGHFHAWRVQCVPDEKQPCDNGAATKHGKGPSLGDPSEPSTRS
ncbi:colipase isoform X3 [Fukomys damarensis]|uniref:colipase isoform X3 n=1 Tax=Fukomys damarensis TaxID=885580 RepID=UPI001455CC5A|nr:colipase isoform X3 [Fukomys damarensis]